MEFEENLEVFYFFGIVHCKHAALLIGLTAKCVIGLLSVVGLSGAGVAFFEWWRHDSAIDVIALTGFSIFLVSGVLAHSSLLYAIQTTRVRYVLVFFIFHGFMIAVSTITALIALGEIVSHQDEKVDESDKMARVVLIASPLASAIQVLMVIVVVRARWYLRLKGRYLRNGRPPRVNQVSRFGFSPSSLNKKNEESTVSTAVIPHAGAPPLPSTEPAAAMPLALLQVVEPSASSSRRSHGSTVAPLTLTPYRCVPSLVPPTESRPKVVAIRVKTPDFLTGPVRNPIPIN